MRNRYLLELRVGARVGRAISETVLAQTSSKEYYAGMTRKSKPISEQLREAILDADVSRYRISQDTGITEATLSRFVNGVAGLRLSAIDTLGEYLGLAIVVEGKHAKKKGG